MTKIISSSEVKQHNHGDSCWIIIHNDVYDVTSFLEEHPGGEESLLDVAGKDGSQEFEDVGHSDDARELMKKYKIGTLPPGEIPQVQYDCEHIPKLDKPEKSWRTYDGSSSSRPSTEHKTVHKTPSTPQIVRRVQSIIVPKERLGSSRPRTRRRGPPCGSGGSKLKWAVLALASAVVIGLVLKKYLAT